MQICFAYRKSFGFGIELETFGSPPRRTLETRIRQGTKRLILLKSLVTIKMVLINRYVLFYS